LVFFDWEDRLKKLDKNGDPLVKLNQVIPWESFRGLLNKVQMRKRKSNAGTKFYGVVLKLLQNLAYNFNRYALLVTMG